MCSLSYAASGNDGARRGLQSEHIPRIAILYDPADDHDLGLWNDESAIRRVSSIIVWVVLVRHLPPRTTTTGGARRNRRPDTRHHEARQNNGSRRPSDEHEYVEQAAHEQGKQSASVSVVKRLTR